MKKTKVLIDVAKLHYAVELTRALAHPLRMKILEFIDRNDAINVNTIYRNLQLEQSITSHHLRILRQAKVVSAKKEGKLMIYSINYDVVTKAVSAVNNFLGK
ncbi:MAG TPA: transcriptional regulator [Bacteroidetes bacterium]|nr:transcriptional regulator [Bacteroidota bacterium]